MLNRLIGMTLVLLLFAGCKKDEDSFNSPLQGIERGRAACGSDMAWLLDLINKANEDRETKKYKGNYMGSIYLTSYKNNPVFVCFMMMNSGGLAFHALDCNKQYIQIDNADLPNFASNAKTKGKLIYQNMPE